MSKSYFRSSGFSPDLILKSASGQSINAASLPAFLRTLLVMDGTVTKALESWFWEPVQIISKSNISAENSLQREVILSGKQSQQRFACARSDVALSHLPETIALALQEGKIGIGELLRDKGLETYRDIFAVKLLSKDEVEQDDLLQQCSQSSDFIARAYNIEVNAKVAITVTEFFPINLYKPVRKSHKGGS